jgi:hypothetical protein
MVLREFTKRTQTNVFLIVDDHGKDLVDEVIREGLNERNCLALSGTIEDCYPIKILVEVMNEIYGLNLTEEDIDPDKPRVEEIKRILNEKIGMSKRKTKWKCPFGREVALRMSAEDIPDDLKGFLERISN